MGIETANYSEHLLQLELQLISSIKNFDGSPDNLGEFLQYLGELLNSSASSEETESINSFSAESIYKHFLGELGLQASDIQNIGLLHKWYVVIYLSDGKKLIYDLSKVRGSIPQDNSGDFLPSFELKEQFFLGKFESLNELYDKNLDIYRKKWGSFQDHLNAMNAIFKKNQTSERGGGFLDTHDVFDAQSSMRSSIMNPELIKKFDKKSIYDIQQLAREEYRELAKLLEDAPFDMLPPDMQYAVSQSFDTYTRMIMGVGDMYEGGARLFDKSESEVSFGIYFSIENLKSSEDVLLHWLSIRKEIDENNFQDTTVEQRAYPQYMKMLNSTCYQKMLDLGASREKLLRFAKVVSGHDNSVNGGKYSYNHNFTPNHYDSEFANMILGSLIGMPGTKEDNKGQEPSSEGNILERLLQKGIMQSVEDDRVPNPENVSLLYPRAQAACERIAKDTVRFPEYINDAFFGGRNHSSITGPYNKLSLANQISISALARFIDYIEQSIQEEANESRYQEQLKENSRILGKHFEDPYQGMTYIEEYNIFRLNVMDITGRPCFIDISTEKIQNVAAGKYYIQNFARILRERRIVFNASSQAYQGRDENGKRKQYSEEEIRNMIGDFDGYGASEGAMMMATAPSISDTYLEKLKNLSLSESVEHVSSTIMAKFDSWDFNTQEDEFIDIESLDTVFSDTDIDILRTWTDINGLGKYPWEWSDTSNEMKMTGIKIALIIAISAAASYATGGLAGAAGLTQVGALMRGYQVVDGVRKSTMAGQMVYGGVMGAYASPVSWGVYPHGYASKEEMFTDMISDVGISSITGVAGGWLGMKWAGKHEIAANVLDFSVLGLATEMARMKVVEEAYHPGENFLDEKEIGGV